MPATPSFTTASSITGWNCWRSRSQSKPWAGGSRKCCAANKPALLDAEAEDIVDKLNDMVDDCRCWAEGQDMVEAALDGRVAALRRFNRFYTQKIGALEEGLLASPFSLAEARVLHDIARAGEATAARLGKELGLDRGYLSRILRGFERRG